MWYIQKWLFLDNKSLEVFLTSRTVFHVLFSYHVQNMRNKRKLTKLLIVEFYFSSTYRLNNSKTTNLCHSLLLYDDSGDLWFDLIIISTENFIVRTRTVIDEINSKSNETNIITGEGGPTEILICSSINGGWIRNQNFYIWFEIPRDLKNINK